MPHTDKASQDFASRMTEILNQGALNQALALGYRLEIFEAMARLKAPVTCAELADRTGLSPRYLREWLGIVTAGGVVELKAGGPGEDRFHLPSEHAAYLCRGSDLNYGVYTQEIPLLTACAGAPLEKAFRTGRGIEALCYPDFQAFMAELADAKHQQTLVQTFLPSVANGALVKGLERGIAVCDLGCGTGLACRLMAKAFPQSSFLGLDISGQAIAMAREAAEKEGLANLEYRVADAAGLCGDADLGDAFDYVTAFDAIHDQSHPEKALLGVRHILKPGGLFSMIDIKAASRLADNLGHPLAPFLYTVSLMHCLPMGLNDSGKGLGMMWGKETALAMLTEAGFAKAEVVEMEFDPFNQHFLCTN